MDYKLIADKTLEVFIECDIREFPIDCFAILKHYDFRVYSYKEIQATNSRLHEICKKYSNDAFRYENIICYNQKSVECRIRFSLMHELGHYLLGHKGHSREIEDEADYFASCILAPRIAVRKLWYPTADDIHNKFGLSYAASNRVLNDLEKWRCRQHYDSEEALRNFLYPPSKIEKPKATRQQEFRKGRHKKEWAEIEERNKFIEENICDLTEYALMQYERSLHLGYKI